MHGWLTLKRNHIQSMTQDSFNGLSNLNELNLEYSVGDVAGFEDVTVGYGRYKVAFGGEESSSSKKIKTVERSNLNNFY